MTPLCVVLAGTLAGGVKLRGILEQREARALVAKLGAEKGQYAEMLELINPAKLGGPEAAINSPVIVFVGSVTKGVQAIGPFEDTVEAGGFVQLMGDDRDVHVEVLEQP